MSKPKKKGEPSEVDDLFSEFADDEPVEDPEEEAHLEAVPDPEPTPEPEPEAEPAAAEATPAEGEPPEPEPTHHAEPPADWVEQAKKADEGRIRELIEMRRKLREANAQLGQQQAPNPHPNVQEPGPAPPVQSQAPQGLSPEDLITFNDGKAGIDLDRLGQFVQQVTAPDPVAVQNQAKAQRNEQFTREFVAENPPIHTAALGHVKMAYEYTMAHAKDRATASGLDTRAMNFDEFMQFVDQTGIKGEVAAMYPHMADDYETLLLADYADSNSLMKTALHRYAGRVSQALGGVPHVAQTQQTPGFVPPAQNTAPDISQVGQTSPPPKQGDQQRLEKLEKMENDDPLIDPALVKEADALRRSLGVYKD